MTKNGSSLDNSNIGKDGQIMVADSTDPKGWKWAYKTDQQHSAGGGGPLVNVGSGCGSSGGTSGYGVPGAGGGGGPGTHRHVDSPFTINNKFIVAVYDSDRALKSVERNGFAMVAQKVSVVGLELLMDATIQDGKQTSRIVPKGSLVYIKEEFLHSNPTIKRVYESDAIVGKFNIIEMAWVEFVVPR